MASGGAPTPYHVREASGGVDAQLSRILEGGLSKILPGRSFVVLEKKKKRQRKRKRKKKKGKQKKQKQKKQKQKQQPSFPLGGTPLHCRKPLKFKVSFRPL